MTDRGSPPTDQSAALGTTPSGFAPAPWITHERLDDEVMAIDLETGAYFALDDAAADVWTLVAGGQSPSEVATVLAARYDVDPETVRVDVDRFMEVLQRERLVVRADAVDVDGRGADTTSLPTVPEPRAYAAPTLEKHDDLEELLRLDPIHEVDDVGWPVPRRD